MNWNVQNPVIPDQIKITNLRKKTVKVETLNNYEWLTSDQIFWKLMKSMDSKLGNGKIVPEKWYLDQIQSLIAYKCAGQTHKTWKTDKLKSH